MVGCFTVGIAAVALIAVILIRRFISCRRKKKASTEHAKKQDELFNSIEWQRSVNEFLEVFDFDPKLLSKKTYKLEVLVRLWLISDNLLTLVAVKSKSKKNRQRYSAVSKEFMEAVKILTVFNQRFGNQIPHWTGLRGFVHGATEGQRLKMLMRWHDKRAIKLLVAKQKQLKHVDKKVLALEA
jgi:hypothetical protein